jgi:hypothetical protein
MKAYFASRLMRLSSELENISPTSTILDRCTEALEILDEFDREFKEKLKVSDFSSTDEEIYYFRYQKPVLLCELIYYYKLYQLELKKPIGSAGTIHTFYRKQLTRIEEFFFENNAFISYIRSGLTDLDAFFFLRNNISYKTVQGSSYLILDPTQSTSYDWKLGKIYAHERLAAYLDACIKELQPGCAVSADDPLPVNEKHLREHPLPAETMLKSHQVERRLHISYSTLQRLRRSGALPFVKVGGTIYYKESDVLHLIERNRHSQLDDQQ